ncbi:uncharacterized protein EKO05_0005580 [Ascochyta rabiei]|uniref:Uncharacterized protein n=1 Tax=Didymella rabiei TaxID=5454 RepID=A0A163MAU3_DIDRA|nr:uncharacterized protein EKO05_0005580 [Ascochyta rabiei]KZM28550.1 hypothetical protein ST47_g310 [Ascochyta rabiei]UPX15121.1 hypothetical protein EKO05_0005580 [Ascochyta rabiei]
MEFSLFQYRALSGTGCIRLASILPDERGADVKLELEHADLDSDLTYECLSYAWGPVDHDLSITLNGSSFLVSSTLHIALEHLRYAQQKRKIWIDAICINQADVEERSKQVAIMKRIYQKATRVVVWLGPATESSDQAMKFLKMMATAKKESGRRILKRGHGRVASDTSSDEEEEHRVPFTERISSTSNDIDEVADLQNENASTYSLDKTVPHDRSQEKEKGPTIAMRLIDYSVGLLERLLDQTFFRQYHNALATAEATKNNFVVTGFPVLDDISRDSRMRYFENEWESHWQALDDLLARPWWGRTWIVQEVWSASKVLMQCGDHTIKWKRFRTAMDYSEAWDNMGDAVKGTNRGQHWEALRRRYTLAINLAKARVNGSTLSTLLVTTWDRESTDPRDKVFAMLALVGEAENVSLIPDYSKSMEQVYREVAREIIFKQGQMDILLAASGVDSADGIPSWVPDWRCETAANKPSLLVNRHLMMKLYYTGSMDKVVLNGHGYRAAGDSEVFASFSNELSVLTVLSKRLDRVAEVCDANIAELQDHDFTERAFDFILQSEFVSEKTKRKESYARNHSDGSKVASILLTTLTGGGKIKDDRWAPTIRNIMRQRRLFVSQDGRLGIGPKAAQPGDVIFIISGCNFPIVLRPREDKFAVVGEAYIHGHMSGESLACPWYRLWPSDWEEISLL